MMIFARIPRAFNGSLQGGAETYNIVQDKKLDQELGIRQK